METFYFFDFRTKCTYYNTMKKNICNSENCFADFRVENNINTFSNWRKISICFFQILCVISRCVFKNSINENTLNGHENIFFFINLFPNKVKEINECEMPSIGPKVRDLTTHFQQTDSDLYIQPNSHAHQALFSNFAWQRNCFEFL